MRAVEYFLSLEIEKGRSVPRRSAAAEVLRHNLGWRHPFANGFARTEGLKEARIQGMCVLCVRSSLILFLAFAHSVGRLNDLHIPGSRDVQFYQPES
jgi:hypothetical protein